VSRALPARQTPTWVQAAVCAVAAASLLVHASGARAAGPVDEGLQAIQRGDYATALALLGPEASRGDANAESVLGLMYVNGQGVPHDPVQALYWLLKAANQGVAAAQNQVALIYCTGGPGVPQDLAQGATWFRKAADQDDATAQENLALMYDNGQGVAQDYAAAVYWFRRAAGHGDLTAEFNLGLMYNSGQGVAKDASAAVGWWSKAADRGYADAQNNLGAAYLFGEGVPRDAVQAYRWFSLAAADYGAADDKAAAVKNRDVAAQQLSPAQLTTAMDLVRAWSPLK
jgi:uncharacterized protein